MGLVSHSDLKIGISGKSVSVQFLNIRLGNGLSNRLAGTNFNFSPGVLTNKAEINYLYTTYIMPQFFLQLILYVLPYDTVAW